MKIIPLILLHVFFIANFSITAAPVIGSNAPDFKLADQHSKTHSLSDYKGKWLVVYFYPKDDTPGCTVEAGEFRDSIKQLEQRNAVVLGISLDDVESHKDFSDTLELNFSLLADVEKTTAKNYGVLTNLGIIAYSSRETFIIDPEGRIAHHFDDVDPKTHVKEVLGKLDDLSKIYE